MKNKSYVKLVLFITLGVLIVVGGVLFYFAYTKYQDIQTDPAKIFESAGPVITGGPAPSGDAPSGTPEGPAFASSAPSATGTAATEKTVEIDGKRYMEKPHMLNILFLGIDTNKERIADKKGYRSDMIMICAVDMDKRRARLISIPRDTYTEVCRVDENTGAVTATEMGRINSAYSYGGGKDKHSYPNAIRAVEHFMNVDKAFHLDIRYWAGIDIDGIAKVAGILSGVPVKLDEDFPGIGHTGETVTLKGDKAMDYVRDRKNAGGDLGRTRRQQLFVMAMAKRIQKMGAMQAAPKLFDKVSSFMTTNFNLDEVVALAAILDKMQVGKIEHVTVDGSGDSSTGAYYYHAKPDSIREIMLKTYYTPVS